MRCVHVFHVIDSAASDGKKGKHEGGQMDFIERIWGVSPDGGSGMLEALIVVAFLIIAGLAVGLRKRLRIARLRHPD